uniref:Uncharacterized protein n=1 Tax=Anguilla anguilla TaxID=7936 RepID=A0A0E9P9E0_ANGAN
MAGLCTAVHWPLSIAGVPSHILGGLVWVQIFVWPSTKTPDCTFQGHD